ncbi:MAG: acyl-CoA/acyl-ACP dehydrogenase [Desulfobacteraceae bacterium]|nr:acyl-CoA/acyl-ACP dehydrogenase [Desulfobacteraceae bacterium]MBC2756997.1 acyl-CoA/acyl-ACP dehydrogenase [Desulfobacteraceae bacterium]
MIAGTNKELKLLDKASAEFARKELAPNREENDKFPFSPFFTPVLEKAYSLDFFHALLPEKLGGIGHGVTALSVILYNICREDSSLGGIIFTHTAAQEILLAADAGNLIQQITKSDAPVNECLIAFPTFNNPSEIENMAVFKKKDTGYALSGAIDYMVLGGLASHALLPARYDGTNGFSFFLIDLAAQGVSISDPIHSLGLHACPAADIRLENVEGSLVGEERQGAAYFEAMTDRMSVPAAAMSAGIMKGSFSEALEYSRGRFQGGREIINWSEVKMILADMAVKIQNSEMTISRACQAVDNTEKGWQHCSRAAAISIQEAACDLTTWGIQVLGGVGYMKDFGQEKRFRDAKHLQALLGLAPMRKLKFFKNLVKN